MYSFEGPRKDVQDIKFGKDREDALRKYLQEEHEQAINERSSQISKWKVWAKQANSRLERSDAGPRDSNIDMTLTRERIFQSSSRLQTPILQQDPIMVAPPRRGSAEDISGELEELIDFILDKANIGPLTEEWVEQFEIFPYGVVKTPFVTKVKQAKIWREIFLNEYNQLKSDGKNLVVRRELADDTVKYFTEVEAKYTDKEGAFPFVIPAEDFLTPSYGAADIDEAPWVTHRLYLTKNCVKNRIKAGIYNKKTSSGDDVLENLGRPSKEPDRLLDVHEKQRSEATSKQYEVMETYLCFDVEGKDEEVEIIITWERESGLFLRAVYNFYQQYPRPFVIHQYRRIVGMRDGVPLTFYLEPLHRAYSASFNQRLDAGSKANEIAVLLPDGHPMLEGAESNGSIRGGVYRNPGFTKEDIVTFSVSQPWTQLPQLEDKLEQHADRMSHLSPQSFGKEETDRPTAAGTLQIIEEGRMPQYVQLDRFRESFATVVKHMLARYRQFFPEGLEYYVQMQDPENPERASMIQKVFEWPDGVLEDEVVIETKVSSSQMSKVTQKQEIIALLDRMPQVYETIMGMAGAAVDPMNPGAVIAAKLLSGYQTTVDKFMNVFDIGKKDQLNPPDLVSEVQSAQIVAKNLKQMEEAIKQLQTQIANLQTQNAQYQQWFQTAQTGVAPGPGSQPVSQGPTAVAGA